MKKLWTKIFGLSTLAIFGCICFSACTPTTTYYKIQATSSNALQGGTVQGGANYKSGSQVTLTATPINNNNFLAWIKNEVIVSYDQEYTFTVNSSTQGKYTALFTTQTYKFGKLQYAQYNMYSFNTKNECSVMLKSLELSYNTLSDLYKPFITISNKALNTKDNNSITENASENANIVLYAKKYYFSLNMTLQYDYSNPTSSEVEQLNTTFDVDFSKVLSTEATTTANITTYSCNNYTLELTDSTQDGKAKFELKATIKNLPTSNLWNSSNDDYNNQSLILSFIYQNPLNSK